jgi:DNA ligase-1
LNSFHQLAELCRTLTETRSRKKKAQLVAGYLRQLDPSEVPPAARFLVGSPFAERDQRSLEVSWATLRSALDHTEDRLDSRGLSVVEVERAFSRMAAIEGSGSKQQREAVLIDLLRDATEDERETISRIIFGEMQHGVGVGVMLDALAMIAEAPLASVQRAHMLWGDLGELARRALLAGKEGIEAIRVELFRPIRPMLAQLGEGVEEVIVEHGGTTALEYKFDGARVQIHRDGDLVRIFSRRLSDVSNGLPDVADLVRRNVRVHQVILDGEVIALGDSARPLPFQHLMRRFRRIHGVEAMATQIPVQLCLFDILFLDGSPLIDHPYSERWERLAAVCPPELLAPRLITSDPVQAQQFLDQSMDAGHEGLMAKALDSRYEPGARGKRWFKIKPTERLDLVILAADWGYGRRTGWLSNYLLGVWDEERTTFRSVGKTYKGLTDDQFRWMTERLQSIKTSETRYTVRVRPEVVVEVAYNEIQKSSKSESGYSLRFARIKRIREDKGPQQADTIARVHQLYQKQFERKAQYGEDEF